MSATGGVGVQSVLPGGPAAKAGITYGSVITAIDGKPVRVRPGAAQPAQHLRPGQLGQRGVDRSARPAHTGTVTLATGPAD